MFDNLTVQLKANIGKLVRTLGNREGLTQEELAAKLSLSRITIQNLEGERTLPLRPCCWYCNTLTSCKALTSTWKTRFRKRVSLPLLVMAKNNLISIHCFGEGAGLLGFDENRVASYFQYQEAFLKKRGIKTCFPMIFKRIKQTQVFNKYNSETFRGLPPMIADSQPDLFGNIIFQAWMESAGCDLTKISVLEQLAYVGTRGMGHWNISPATRLSLLTPLTWRRSPAMQNRYWPIKMVCAGTV